MIMEVLVNFYKHVYSYLNGISGTKLFETCVIDANAYTMGACGLSWLDAARHWNVATMTAESWHLFSLNQLSIISSDMTISLEYVYPVYVYWKKLLKQFLIIKTEICIDDSFK